MERENSLGFGIQINKIPKYANQNGSFKVKINEQEVELNVNNIQAIYYYNGYYYIVYSNPSIQLVQIPYLASKLDFEIKEVEKEVCKKCGDEIEWDADEPYCPSCGYYRGSNYIKLKKIIYDIEQEKELEEFVSKLFNVKAKYHKFLYNVRANLNLSAFPKVINLFNSSIEKIGVVENPVFEHYYYDSFDTTEESFEGKFIIIYTYSYVDPNQSFKTYGYHLLSFEGNPNFNFLNNLIEQLRKQREEEEKREEEKRRKWEEERRKKEEEEEKLWSNESNIVKEILSKMPSWADGVIIKSKSYADMDGVITFVFAYPIKKSNWNNDYYTSLDWKPISTNVPDKYLAKYEGKVILKDGKIANAKIGTQEGKYYPISLA
jgi:ribosomal protein L37E